MDKTVNEFQAHEEPDGITIDATETDLCVCTWVKIENENGAEAMGKPTGNYVTIEVNIKESGQQQELYEIAETVSEYLVRLMNIAEEDSVLVVGVGNRSVLADSLGVRVADKIFVTRHMVGEVNQLLGTKVRPVSAISPGVMGVTGMNTAEIVRSICDEVKPKLVIVIDALAARRTSRLCSTIQLCDTGITPAAGLMGKDKRLAIDADYLGIPVISIGVPTVINAATIVADVFSLLAKKHISTEPENTEDEEEDGVMDAELLERIQQCTDAMFQTSAFVTPKEIDAAIHYAAYIISTAINKALFGEEWEQMPSYSY